MNTEHHAYIGIDLDQFKLRLTLPGSEAVSFHFDTPSRRFYLSVIALVAEQMMRQENSAASVPLEDHSEVLALLNETVGGSAGSSDKKKLLPRIYRKWKSALPDLENAPLFKVMGRKKTYDESSAWVYRFDRKIQDVWANLFEYQGSGEKVRLRFSVEKVGVGPKDIVIVYGNERDTETGRAWDRFIESLAPDVKDGTPTDVEKDQRGKIESERNVSFELKSLLQEPGDIEKIPLKTRLELIARLAMTPGHVSSGRPESPGSARKSTAKSEMSFPADPEISENLIGDIFNTGNDNLYYAAPELQDGRSPSPRSEVYALGVLLYQVVVGDLSRPLDAGWKETVTDDILREDIAACVETLPEKRLSSPMALTRRLRTLDERRKLLLPEMTLRTQNAFPNRRRKRRWIAYGFAMAVILALLVLPVLYYQKMNRAEAARKAAYKTNLPKIRELLEEEKYVAAYGLAKKTEEIIPEDPTLQRHITDATNTLNIETTPPGAKVSYRPYEDLDGPWMDLGVSPIKNVKVPVGMHRFKIQKDGFVNRVLTKPVKLRGGLAKRYEELERKSWRFNLYEKGILPQGMLPVDSGTITMALNQMPPGKVWVPVDRFFIDETEVTNRAYKEFVNAGGYSDPVYWDQAFVNDGRVIPWAEAMGKFVDRTGRPGPSTWEFGNYLKGRDEYPVSGVSWHEAAAYARFRGKKLPTIYHWVHAAFPRAENLTPLSPLILPQSNIEKKGPAEAGSFPGIGSSGAKDMAGNVREWCSNAVGERRYCLGGMWEDPAYMFTEGIALSAWDRSAGNGFRCALYPRDAAVQDELLKDINLGFRDPYSIPPYSKKAFSAIKAMFAYKPIPLNPVVESRKKTARGWVRETVSIDAAYNGERLILYLDLPAGCKPPYKTLIYFPGGNAFKQKTFSRNFMWEPWDLFPENGRALVSPSYAGTYERGGGDATRFAKTTPVQRFRQYLNDLRRTMDYLETREDIDGQNIVYIGVCVGALFGPIFAPYEERIRGLVLVSGGIAISASRPKPKGLVQPLVTVPVLMLNGKYDFAFPLKTHQLPLFELISTPPEHKKHVIYDCGHLPLPRAPMMKEIFDWLDKYQGPVECGSNGKTVTQLQK